MSETDTDLYVRAALLVVTNKRASTSWLQRQLAIGYNSAARLIERMEKDGIVSHAGHNGARTILKDEVTLGQLLGRKDLEELAAKCIEAGVTVGTDASGTPQIMIPVDLPRANRPADERLHLLIERVERLEEERKGIADDIKDVYAEAKATGYDAKIMKQIVRLRKMKPDDRREMEAILDTYKNALGMD